VSQQGQLDAVKKEKTWTTIEDEADAEGLWQLVEQKHKVRTASKVKEITKLTTRANYQMICQRGNKTIIAYKERFKFTLKSYEDQGNKMLDPPDIAMDFFEALTTCGTVHSRWIISMDSHLRRLILPKT
jgi:hypothetical protein